MPKTKKEIIHYLANKHDLPLQKIEQMVNYQFKYTSDVIKVGEFDGVRIPYFGLFFVNPNRVKHLTKLKEKKDAKK